MSCWVCCWMWCWFFCWVWVCFVCFVDCLCFFFLFGGLIVGWFVCCDQGVDLCVFFCDIGFELQQVYFDNFLVCVCVLLEFGVMSYNFDDIKQLFDYLFFLEECDKVVEIEEFSYLIFELFSGMFYVFLEIVVELGKLNCYGVDKFLLMFC